MNVHLGTTIVQLRTMKASGYHCIYSYYYDHGRSVDHSHSTGNLVTFSQLAESVCLWTLGGNPENLEETHQVLEEHANSMRIDQESGIKPGPLRTAEPLEYHRSFLKENCRPDGRELGEFRPTTLNIGSINTADGSALVKIGNTTVICGIKAELAMPAADAPDRGYIVPNVDLPPLCSSRFRPGPPGEQAQVASQFIADVIDDSNIIKKEDLCIEKSKLCWVLYCDIMCLDYDGNLLDACIIALLAALKNAQLPKVTINKETDLAEVDMQQKRHLQINKHPVASSFAVFDDAVNIVDPTTEEESLATALITVVTDEDNQLCAFHKPGGSSLSAEKLQDCISRAVTRNREINKLIDKVSKSTKSSK